MKPYQQAQAKLDSVIPFPKDFPVVYVLGDTGSGKSTLIRQLLGTGQFSFPTTQTMTTTVAPTEYIISNDLPLRAAFLLKPLSEIQGYVEEILENVVQECCSQVINEQADEDELVARLGESSDQRFRLRYILNEGQLKAVAVRVKEELAVPITNKLKKLNYDMQSPDLVLVIGLELSVSFSTELENIRELLTSAILSRLREVCGLNPESQIPEVVALEGGNDGVRDFVRRLKLFLGSEEGAISPVIDRARISGNLIASWLPAEFRMVFIDSEGIGHNLKQAQGTLSTSHYDYFYDSDAIVLIEDGSKPFTGGGMTALSNIIAHGYFPKLFIGFTHLDRVQANGAGRPQQIKNIKPRLRNAESSLRLTHQKPGLRLERVQYLALNETQPDNYTEAEIIKLLEAIANKHKASVDEFIAPVYDYGLIDSHLNEATSNFRTCWKSYLFGNPDPLAQQPWQSVKAFNRRMTWKDDGYGEQLRPVAQLHNTLLLTEFLGKPYRWEADKISHKQQERCIEVLKQEVSKELLAFTKGILIEGKHPKWKGGMEFSGSGSTVERTRLIYEIMCDCAPEVTDAHANALKNAVIETIEISIKSCSKRNHPTSR